MPQTHKFQRLLPCDPARLHSVEEWLRGFCEQKLPNLPNVFYCRKCGIRILASPDPVTITDHPCGPIRRLDEPFWQRLSNRIKQHYRKDRLLFARLKAEYPVVLSVPELCGPLAWVTIEWKKATPPPGRPRGLERQLFLASWLCALARSRVVIEQERRPQKEIRRSSGKSRRVTSKELLNGVGKPPCLLRVPPIMTLSGAIELLTGKDLKKAKNERFSWTKDKLFGGRSIKELMQLRSAFQKDWKKQFGGAPIRLSRREAERMLILYKNVQSGGTVRIKGLKLRDKKSKKTERTGALHAYLPDAETAYVLMRTSSSKPSGTV